MTPFQIIAIGVLGIGILGAVVGLIWIMVLSHGTSGEVSFRAIKETIQAREYRKVAPIVLPMVSIYVISFGVALVLFAFGAPILVSLLWLGASIYAVVQTLRGFARA